ncbi:MAG: carboxylating nicotinate-nucleotide diphosphorylase [Pelagibacteraceae bacterium]
MNYKKFNKEINQIINLAILEDHLHKDITSKLSFKKNHTSLVKIICKEKAVIFGIEIVKKILQKVDKRIKIKTFVKDGSIVKKNKVIASLKGKTISILKSERTLLNFLGQLSGVATQTNQLKKLTKKYKTKICCTRKTLPGLRVLQKFAVETGGGTNNRFNLEEEIFIKDNHHLDKISFREKIIKIIKLNKRKKIITVEVDSINQLKSITDLKINRILLDNFNPKKLKLAVKLIPKNIETEASGGINKKNIVSYAKTGVKRISLGSLTHSVKNIDFSLIF